MHIVHHVAEAQFLGLWLELENWGASERQFLLAGLPASGSQDSKQMQRGKVCQIRACPCQDEHSAVLRRSAWRVAHLRQLLDVDGDLPGAARLCREESAWW